MAYAEALKTWQKALNLVAPATLPDIWHRHFGDSAQLWALLPPEAKRAVDLGSGAGFPGLVLAILGAERGLGVTLVEADRRKAAFLGHVARETGIAVDIIVARIESNETRVKVGTVDVVTARALAPLPRLLEWSAPLFGPSTVGLFLKGRDAERELRDARQFWSLDAQSAPSMTDPDASIVIVRSPIEKP